MTVTAGEVIYCLTKSWRLVIGGLVIGTKRYCKGALGYNSTLFGIMYSQENLKLFQIAMSSEMSHYIILPTTIGYFPKSRFVLRSYYQT